MKVEVSKPEIDFNFSDMQLKISLTKQMLRVFGKLVSNYSKVFRTLVCVLPGKPPVNTLSRRASRPLDTPVA